MHNFTSAAVGIAIAVAMIRGFSRHQANGWAISGQISFALRFMFSSR